MQVWVKMEDALTVIPVLIFLLYMFLNFETDGKMNNIIILQHQKPWCFSPIKVGTSFCAKSEILVFKQDDFFP